MRWYGIIRDKDNPDDFDLGCFDKKQAIKMAQHYDAEYIAVCSATTGECLFFLLRGYDF